MLWYGEIALPNVSQSVIKGWLWELYQAAWNVSASIDKCHQLQQELARIIMDAAGL